MKTKQQISDDLDLTAAWCEYKFPKCGQIILFAGVYFEHCASIAMIAADYQFILTRDGPLVDEAYKAMACLGYEIGSNDVNADFRIVSSGCDRSNHLRAKAISHFSKIIP